MNERARRYHTISWVAEHYGIHPQTLRLYDDETCERLEYILTLTRDLGVNLAGVEVVLRMKDQIDALQQEVSRVLMAMDREIARRGMVPRERALAPRPGSRLVPSEDE